MNESTVSRACVQFGELRRDVIEPALWTIAILAWGIGDYATTHYALAYVPVAYESTELVARVLDVGGAFGHAAFKSLALGLGWVYYQHLPIVAAPRLGVDEDRIRAVLLAIPAAFAFAGLWLTLTNIDVILIGGGA